jgi:hypothetical protein
MIALITIAVSTNMILYSNEIYDVLERPLKIFESRRPFREVMAESTGPAVVDVVVIGLGRYGWHLGSGLDRGGLHVLGIDFDPEAVRRWRTKGLPSQYGDAEDPDMPRTLPMTAKYVVSTISDTAVSRALVQHLREAGFAGRIALTANTLREAERVLAQEPDLLLLPYIDAAKEAADEILLSLERKPLRPARRVQP